MTTLVTGAGMIGSLTAAMLAADGEKVVLADICQSAAAPGIVAVALDVTDIDALAQTIDTHGITSIIHTAALLSNAIRLSPLDGVRVNIMGTANILELARRLRLGRIVLASSTTVGYPAFGSLDPAPIKEDFVMRVVAERPASIYAATKLAGEHLSLLFADLYGVDAICLRYGAVIGGSIQSPTSVPGQLVALLAAAARIGRGRLDNPLLIWGGREEFVDARDCARANVLALRARGVSQRVFNISSGEWFTLPEFVEAAQTVFGQFELDLPPEPETGFAGFPHKRPARSDLREALGQLNYLPRFRLVDSLAAMANAQGAR